jgi:hypothetical protein
MKTMKYILIIFILLLTSITTVNASTKTYERTEKDLGVNKKWIIEEIKRYIKG